MLYMNTELRIQTREMKFGEITGVAIGESGRGRQEVFLPTPKDIEGEMVGLRSDLSIGTSKSGRPRIKYSNGENEMYMILCTYKAYTRKGNGYVQVPTGQDVKLIARGNGADGRAGRIGQWDALVLGAQDGDVFRVVWSGYKYGYEATFYVVSDGDIYAAYQSELEDLYENLGLEIPFALDFRGSGFVINKDEWVTL